MDCEKILAFSQFNEIQMFSDSKNSLKSVYP
jgi:hypothetical protein